MKKILFVATLFAFVGLANAQQKSATPAQSVQKERTSNFDEWSAELNLSEKQKADITAINAKYVEKKKALRATGTAEDFKKISDDQQKEINAVLTAEQLKKSEVYNQRKVEEKNQKAGIKVAK